MVTLEKTEEPRQYCVTVKIYTWALDEQAAIDNLVEDLEYLMKADSAVAGFIYPKTFDVVEDTEADSTNELIVLTE